MQGARGEAIATNPPKHSRIEATFIFAPRVEHRGHSADALRHLGQILGNRPWAADVKMLGAALEAEELEVPVHGTPPSR
jgi:hypothetical protein